MIHSPIRLTVLSILLVLSGCALERPMESQHRGGAVPALTSQGHETGNGGSGVQCNFVAGINYVDLLDIWEAQHWGGLSYERVRAPLEVGLSSAVTRMGIETDPAFEEAVRTVAFDLLIYQTEFTVLHPAAEPSDRGSVAVHQNCNLVTLALYTAKRDRLRINAPAFQRLSEIAQSGLYLHEAVSEIFRRWFHTDNTNAARYLTGCSLSYEGCARPKLEGLKCRTKDRKIEAIRGNNRLMITHYNGKPLPLPSYFDLSAKRGRYRAYPRATDNPHWGYTSIPPQIDVEQSESKLFLDGEALTCEHDKVSDL